MFVYVVLMFFVNISNSILLLCLYFWPLTRPKHIYIYRICTIITNKDLQKSCLKELHATLHQRRYPTTLINKGFELAEKIPPKELWNQKKHNSEKPLAYTTIFNQNNPELFTEMIKSRTRQQWQNLKNTRWNKSH